MPHAFFFGFYFFKERKKQGNKANTNISAEGPRAARASAYMYARCVGCAGMRFSGCTLAFDVEPPLIGTPVHAVYGNGTHKVHGNVALLI